MCDSVESEVQNSIDNELENKEDQEQNLSKKQLRKLKKKQQWEANKPAKRAKEREKLKLKRQAARENNVDLGPSRKKLKECTMSNSSCKVRVAVDMSFDDFMQPKDLSKCIKQLLRCYTLNRRAPNPMQLYFTSFEGKCKTEMSKNNGYTNWDVNFCESAYCDIFAKEEIVYLSSESENTISSLDDDKVYVIGGLVDHNTHKGLCHRLAVEKGIPHGQLPITEFLDMKTRKVLTIDHVFEILLGVSTGLSWQDAFLKVIPNRKGAMVKGKGHSGVSHPSQNTESSGTDEASNLKEKQVPVENEVKCVGTNPLKVKEVQVSVESESKPIETNSQNQSSSENCGKCLDSDFKAES